MTSYSTMLVSTKLPSDGARELLAIFSLHDYLKHGGMCNKLSQTRTWRSSVSPENVSIHLHPRYQVRVCDVCYSVYSFSGKCSLSCCDIKFRLGPSFSFRAIFPSLNQSGKESQDNSKIEDFLELLSLSDKYQIDELREKLEDYLIR